MFSQSTTEEEEEAAATVSPVKWLIRFCFSNLSQFKLDLEVLDNKHSGFCDQIWCELFSDTGVAGPNWCQGVTVDQFPQAAGRTVTSQSCNSQSEPVVFIFL